MNTHVDTRQVVPETGIPPGTISSDEGAEDSRAPQADDLVWLGLINPSDAAPKDPSISTDTEPGPE